MAEINPNWKDEAEPSVKVSVEPTPGIEWTWERKLEEARKFFESCGRKVIITTEGIVIDDEFRPGTPICAIK